MMMKVNTIRRLMGASIIGVIAVAPPASAQTATATQPGASTPPPATTAAPKKPTSATPQMIDEAIQRSQARSAKAKALGIPEQWGSEEPFTYVPGRTF
jgi:hypothetical protein